MDPVTAIGLAASTYQLLEASIKLASKCHEIYTTGRDSETDAIERSAKEIQDLSVLASQPSQGTGLSSERERHLHKIANEAEAVSAKLLKDIRDLDIQPYSSKYKVACSLLKRLRRAKSIEKQRARLQEKLKLIDSWHLISTALVD